MRASDLLSPARAAILALLSAALLGAGGCDGEKYCRLVIEDPDGVAAGGGDLVITVDDVELVRSRVSAGAFPVTQVLSRASTGEIAALVEVRDGDTAVARDAVKLLFDDQVTNVTAILQKACEEDARCDDGVFGNGAETCKSGVCAAGQPPCVAAVACVDVEASEELQSCIVTPRHERCEPIVTDTGQNLVTFCDGVNGCLPGEACGESADCQSPDACSADPLCVAGRCVPQGRLPVDDQNPCTIDLCDGVAGVLHLEDATAVGNSCPLTSGDTGICLGGDCVVSRCGDGYLDRDAGEACDDGDGQNSDADPNACRTTCALPSCGDGVTDLGEDCDDANDTNTDACVSCTAAACGDGFAQQGVEECDDANAVDSDACVSCRAAACGDGVMRIGVEACDDGNDVDEDACLTSCAANVCGDGARNPATEECDDGNSSENDACLPSCRNNVCGDGRVNVGVEQCDDGNNFAQDACLPGCTLNVCGDGVRDFTDEECDDGNEVGFDGCSSRCDFVAWEVDLGEPIAATSSTVAWQFQVDQGDGTLVTTKALGVLTAAGTLVVLDRTTGAELWRYTSGAAATAPPAVGEAGVYMITDDGVVHGNALGGPAVRAPWTFALDRPSNGTGLSVPVGLGTDGVTAVDEGGKLYQLTHLGTPRAFGSLGFNNTYDLSTDARDYDPAAAACAHCSPTTVHDLNPASLVSNNGAFGLVMPMAGGQVWAWRFVADCTPVVFNEGDVVRQVSFRGFKNGGGNQMTQSPFYATLASGVLRRAAVNADGNGGCAVSIARRTDVTGASPFVTTPIVALDPFTNEDAIYVVDDAGSLHRFVFTPATTPGSSPSLDESFGWPFALGATVTAAPALSLSNDVYVADDGGVVHAIDGISAFELWSQAARGGAPVGSPVVIDAAVFVATTGGVVTALERGDEPAPPTSWSRNGGNVRGNGHPAECSHLGPSGTASLFTLAALLVARRRLLKPRRSR